MGANACPRCGRDVPTRCRVAARSFNTAATPGTDVPVCDQCHRQVHDRYRAIKSAGQRIEPGYAARAVGR